MGVLGGDVTGDRVVNSKDQNYINSKSGHSHAATFRADVTIDGLINGNDASFVGNRNGQNFPDGIEPDSRTASLGVVASCCKLAVRGCVPLLADHST